MHIFDFILIYFDVSFLTFHHVHVNLGKTGLLSISAWQVCFRFQIHCCSLKQWWHKGDGEGVW